MASAKIIKFLLLVLFMFPGSMLRAGSWSMEYKKKTAGTIIINFSEKLAISKIILPTNTEKLWGAGKKCRAATIKAGNKSFLSSTDQNGNELTFSLEGIIAQKIIVNPLYIEVSTTDSNNADPVVEAVRAKIRLIEDKIKLLAQQTIEFQKQNRCFSCHTAYPLAVLFNEADKKGYKIDKKQIEILTESIGATQKADGSFYFKQQPDYGTITPTLCAGAIFAQLARFDRRLLVNLNRILLLLPGWLDKNSNLKSDFYFTPIFIGQTTSTVFEALIIAAIYYFEPSVTGTDREESLRQRLLYLNRNLKIRPEGNQQHNLVLLGGLPYIGQFSPEQKEPLLKGLIKFLENEPEARHIQLRGLAGLFFHRINEEHGLKIAFQGAKKAQTPAEHIWACLLEVLQHQP
jgi:hypothetical protein